MFKKWYELYQKKNAEPRSYVKRFACFQNCFHDRRLGWPGISFRADATHQSLSHLWPESSMTEVAASWHLLWARQDRGSMDHNQWKKVPSQLVTCTIKWKADSGLPTLNHFRTFSNVSFCWVKTLGGLVWLCFRSRLHKSSHDLPTVAIGNYPETDQDMKDRVRNWFIQLTRICVAEDGLATSSLQITVIEFDIWGTGHSTPTPKPSTSEVPQGAKADKNTDHQKTAKKRRSAGVLLKSQYHKAVHIMSNIQNNKEANTVDERSKMSL